MPFCMVDSVVGGDGISLLDDSLLDDCFDPDSLLDDCFDVDSLLNDCVDVNLGMLIHSKATSSSNGKVPRLLILGL